MDMERDTGLDAALDPEIMAALNALLEGERAGVETLVGLVAMATDTIERRALITMGGQAVRSCVDLHERLDQLGAPAGVGVAPSGMRVLAHERIDDRLRAFGWMERELAERCEVLAARDLDDATRALLATLSAVQLAQAAWAERRADEFAATRPSEPGELSEVESSSPAHAIPREAVGAAPFADGSKETSGVPVDEDEPPAPHLDIQWDAGLDDREEGGAGRGARMRDGAGAEVQDNPALSESLDESVDDPAPPTMDEAGVARGSARSRAPARSPRVRRPRLTTRPRERREGGPA